ncbi:MAG: 4-hydroxy-3-methylbut-2-enyl diphosphate reductase [Puniceicoccales bacterium]|nr:4-hydroxy-3-methylbut-2-enyl diphosphate reductase [Puniceicoccales bacterium]
MGEDREVTIAPGAGFCKGVELALKKALQAAKNKKQGSVFSEGELVHNRDVSAQLYAQGICQWTQDVQIHPEDTLLIRAHGISPQRRSFLTSLGCIIEDCTCPLVARIGRIIETHREKGILLLGDRQHEEVEGLCGYAKHVHVCENLNELAQLIDAIHHHKQIGEKILDEKYSAPSEIQDWIMIAQSTLDLDFWTMAKALCAQKRFHAQIFDTICEATKQRQQGLEHLYACDAVIVIGGFHSANTKRLFEKIKKHIATVFWIESSEDLTKLNWNLYKKIGITAGTSTPKSVVQHVFREISKK